MQTPFEPPPPGSEVIFQGQGTPSQQWWGLSDLSTRSERPVALQLIKFLFEAPRGHQFLLPVWPIPTPLTFSCL